MLGAVPGDIFTFDADLWDAVTEATVPNGTAGGDIMDVKVGDEVLSVVVPDGKLEGDTFEFDPAHLKKVLLSTCPGASDLI